MTGKRKEYLLEGLNCANCAAKIEHEVQKLSQVVSATMNFAVKQLTVELDEEAESAEVLRQISKIVHKHEPGVAIQEKISSIARRGNKSGGSEEKLYKKTIVRIGLGVTFFLLALFGGYSSGVEFILFLLSYLLIGGKVILRALRNITRGQVFDENFLMVIATIGAFAIQEFPEAVGVMLFYQIGEFFQDLAVHRSRRSVSELMDIRPDYANLKEGEQERKVPPEEVATGQIILVRPGEKVPLDGTVLEGRSVLDTSALTGEFVPREAEPGTGILAGFINKSGLLTVEVTKTYDQSAVARILDLVENASSRKAPTENFITKFARYYTPAVVLGAAMLAVLPPLIIPGALFSDWVYRALVFLVVSCPCALVISIPLSFFGGIGGASRSGILIKGSNYLEGLNSVRTLVFDKTGTLTEGVFEVIKISPAAGMSKDELLELAALAESYSSHPIAASILRSYGMEADKNQIKSYREIPGHGVKAQIRGKDVVAGSSRLLEDEKIPFTPAAESGTIVYLAVERRYAGYIVIADKVRPDSPEAIRGLREAGIQKIVMLTGDNKEVGERISKELGFDEVYTELLPDQKVSVLEEIDSLKQPGTKVAFIGDGINDAPVLARADIGIAMGGLGSDAAIEAADIVLMTDEPSKILSAVNIARRTRLIVWQNIIFALGVKAAVLLLGALGLANMWEAVFADVGVALIAILNAMRVLKA